MRSIIVSLALLLTSIAYAQDSVLFVGEIDRNQADSILQYGVVQGSCSNSAAITTNNTAIQTALNSGKNIYFPPGNYPFNVIGFNTSTNGQHIRGAVCTGTGTSSPYCPSVMQDCSAPPDYTSNDCNTLDNCGYFSVHVTDVEIDNLEVFGNSGGAHSPLTSHKGIYATAPAINLYVHDVFALNTQGESIYSHGNSGGGSAGNTRFIRNTVKGGSMQGLNSNNYNMKNVQITDNYVSDMTGGCILVAAYDAYVLRNTCQGGAGSSGADSINPTTVGFQVIAYNTINQWNGACCAVASMHSGFTNFGGGFNNFNGPGVVAYNNFTNNLFTHVTGSGGALQIENTTGPMVIAHNTITFNGDRGQPTNPGILTVLGCTPANGCTTPSTNQILISNNTLNGTTNDQTVGILIDSSIPTSNNIQVNSSNTFGTTPTPTQYQTAPSGAPMSLFNPVIQRALPYLPDGLPIN